MNGAFDLAVMVPTARPWDFESESSRMLQKAIAAAGAPVRLIIVENGIAGARPGLESFPGCGEILRLERGNKSAALNAGIRLLSRETLILFFDDDVLVPEGIVAAYAAQARLRGRGHYFGGPTEALYETPPSRAVARFLPNSAKGLSYGDEPRIGRDFFMGGNWAAFSSDVEEAGGFDLRFGPGSTTGATGQETMAQRRMRALGARSVYIPECRVIHRVPRDRCSESFAVARASRNGMELGLASREFPLEAAGRVPRRLLRHGLGLLSSAFRPQERALALACRAAYWKAFLRGLAYAP